MIFYRLLQRIGRKSEGGNELDEKLGGEEENSSSYKKEVQLTDSNSKGLEE